MAYSVCGQTTQPTEKSAAAPAASAPVASPAEQAWPATMEAFAKTLVRGDLPATEAMLGARAIVKRFDSNQEGETARMVARVARSTMVGQHAYLHPPLVMAADIGADFKNAAGIPEKSKLKFMIDDETEMKRANATAVQWVVEQLEARSGMAIGVIVLWTPRPPAPTASAGDAVEYDPIFVLVRGEEVAPHEFKIVKVAYGMPLPEGQN